MAAKLPYVLSPGLIPKILLKMQEARRPERFTQDFLETKLGHSGGSARAVIPLLKRLGFLSTDGTPTPLYDSFRNEHTQGEAMAMAMRHGYKDIFERNEYAGDLPKDKLQSLIMEITGLGKDSRVFQSTVSTFLALKEFADFESAGRRSSSPKRSEEAAAPSDHPVVPTHRIASPRESVGLNLSYTINLNLPETSDPDVFSAIFRALKDNLLPG